MLRIKEVCGAPHNLFEVNSVLVRSGIESVVAFLVHFVHPPSGRRRFHCFAEVRIVNHRFKIGDRVRVIGILADFYPGKIATVVAVSTP